MIWTIVAILIIMWLMGFITPYSVIPAGVGMPWLIHVLLMIAIIVVLVRVIRGRNPI